MKYTFVTALILGLFLFSCSDDPEVEMGPDLAEEIIGSWQLETIRVVGADCQINFGDDVPDEYLADEEGCATPTEVLGNASRCINFELMEGGVGKFLWSEITGGEDVDITYTVENDEFEYCFVDSFCSGSFVLVDDKLESEVELTLDDDCSAVFVLRRK